MTWIKNVLIDIAVTALIAYTTISGAEWGQWIVIIYTPLMLALKIFAFAAGSSVAFFARKNTEAPAWFLHLLYAANTLLLLAHGWWFTGVQWAVIWILSFLMERRRPALKK